MKEAVIVEYLPNYKMKYSFFKEPIREDEGVGGTCVYTSDTFDWFFKTPNPEPYDPYVLITLKNKL